MATETEGIQKVPSTPLSPVARFVFPQIQDNPNGCGPIEVPGQFKDTPYQPFSKDDRLGKVNHNSVYSYDIYIYIYT